MPTSAYEKIEGSKAAKYIERLNKVRSGSAFDATHTALYVRNLPFAPGWHLAEFSDAFALPEKKAIALDNGHECLPVSYEPEFASAFIRSAGVTLNTGTAAEYLRFWFEYVRVQAERFLLVESIDDMPWREEPTPQARKALGKSITALAFESGGPDTFVFKASVLFRDALFTCLVEVGVNGNVAITHRNLVADGLTVTDPLTGF